MTRRLAMQVRTLVVVGLGLIGGSAALAARRRGAAGRVVGVDTDPATLRRAVEGGVVDAATASLDEAVAAAELVLFCTPVDVLPDLVGRAARACPPETILTDAASTKSALVRDVAERLPGQVSFIGGHPLAGSEKQGVQHADADLFQGRVVVLTPTDRDDERHVSRVQDFWAALGARVCRMTPEQHDHALALTSHLPHLVAAALAGAMPPEVAPLTASGFRDTTRIAAGDPALWGGILHANAAEVLAALARFQEQLDRFRVALQAEDQAALAALLASGRAFRRALDGRP